MARESIRCLSRHLAIALLLLLPLRLSAQAVVPEYDLKAAFVYNFALFTDWPADLIFEGGILNICINSSSALRQPLAALDGTPVKGKKIAVRHLIALNNLDSCHVLFVDSNDREHWMRIKKELAGASVLTVSDDDEIGHGGSIIAMAMDRNRIVFDIDTRAARQARLVLSSKLLRLARALQ